MSPEAHEYVVGETELPESIKDAVLTIVGPLEGRTFGATTVQAVTAEIEQDSEETPAIFISFVLSDPAGATWPKDDILSLRRAVFSAANQTNLEFTIYVRLSPTTDAPQADDEVVASGS